MNNTNSFKQLKKAVDYLLENNDWQLAQAFMLDYQPPQKVKNRYYNSIKGINDYNYRKKIKKALDLLE